MAAAMKGTIGMNSRTATTIRADVLVAGTKRVCIHEPTSTDATWDRLGVMAERVPIPIEVYEKLTSVECAALLKERVITDPAYVTPSMRALAAKGMRVLAERSALG